METLGTGNVNSPVANRFLGFVGGIDETTCSQQLPASASVVVPGADTADARGPSFCIVRQACNAWSFDLLPTVSWSLQQRQQLTVGPDQASLRA